MSEGAVADAVGGPIRVGYALREKRVQSLLLPALLEEARARHISFESIDARRSLLEQGEFDLILHKLEGGEWAQQLAEYETAHPDTVLVDPYEAVHRLDDREQMLKVVDEIDKEFHEGVTIGVPKQLFVSAAADPATIPSLVADADLSLPAVSKPTAANGTTSAHQLCLVLNAEGLRHLEPPVVLQEFVNHGGVLFKLYVIGHKVMVFKRQSLPDIPPPEAISSSLRGHEKLPAAAVVLDPSLPAACKASPVEMQETSEGIMEFNRISNTHLSDDELSDGRVVDPPPELMQKLGLELRRLLKLRAFNVDILRKDGNGSDYFIVDINYMPGYERLPDFPSFFLDFIRISVEERRSKLELQRLDPAAKLPKKPLPPPPQAPYPVLPGKRWKQVKAVLNLAAIRGKAAKPAVI